ncbi:FprA family A-type flavoprotein [Methanocaldococcus indicus]|uniref:FprA family A-type flavoprotein n=1 Tax=Methanocaldococcus indicus TaxID=213231 RepID=UPI003C6D1AFF
MVVEIKKNIYWVGAIDWELREFHAHYTPFGTTYNSYLITGEKNILIDTVKETFADELLCRIWDVIDIRDLDYIIVNHAEKDHTGALPKIVEYSGAKIITNEKCKELLSLCYNTKNWEFITVDNYETIKLGNKRFKFIHTPMLHWPDNMITYLADDKILFSNDAFGQHYASTQRFDDDIRGYSMYYAKEYFANVLMPYKTLIIDLIKTIKELEIDIIAPAHGVIWRKYIDEILKRYEQWAFSKYKNKAVIVYDTIYNSTKKMAHALACGLIEEGINVKIFDASNTPLSKIITEMVDAKYVLIGSPTMNRNVHPTIGKLLTYLLSIKPYDKIGVAFGSYGWNECATNKIKLVFEELNYKIIDDDILKIRMCPTKEQLYKLKEFGHELAKIDL